MSGLEAGLGVGFRTGAGCSISSAPSRMSGLEAGLGAGFGAGFLAAGVGGCCTAGFGAAGFCTAGCSGGGAISFGGDTAGACGSGIGAGAGAGAGTGWATNAALHSGHWTVLPGASSATRSCRLQAVQTTRTGIATPNCQRGQCPRIQARQPFQKGNPFVQKTHLTQALSARKGAKSTSGPAVGRSRDEIQGHCTTAQPNRDRHGGGVGACPQVSSWQ